MGSKNTYSVTFFTAMPRGLECCKKTTLSGGGMLRKNNMDVAKKQHIVYGGGREWGNVDRAS